MCVFSLQLPVLEFEMDESCVKDGLPSFLEIFKAAV